MLDITELRLHIPRRLSGEGRSGHAIQAGGSALQMSNAATNAFAIPDGPWNGPSRRVLVAMSGGVDSSVVAAVLKHAGHDVIGVTLQLYDNGAASGRPGACCAGQDIHDARRVAAQLNIPHYVLDYEDRFRRAVVDAFAQSYAQGETPIPCVTCNQRIKFGDLLSTAVELGADLMATGHYVRRLDTPDGPELHRAVDEGRDQSYFLFATTRDQLARLWFPLGGMRKDEVRRLAAAAGIPVAAKPDSQDICFVPSGRYADVVGKLRPDAAEPGEIVHVDGRILGRHQGIMNFTVGQRRGLGLAAGDPLFVVRLVPEQRRVVVGPRSALATTMLELGDTNWLGADPLAPGTERNVTVRVRSTQAPRPARLLVTEDGGVSVVPAEPETGVAKGQACVIYEDASAQARVLGGGIICRTVAIHAGDGVMVTTRLRNGEQIGSGRPDAGGVAG